jgi:predicted nucleic acid-binding protein
MASYLLDTTVLIDHLRGRPHVRGRIRDLNAQGHALGICAINVTEVFSGALPEEQAASEALLSSLVLWDIDYATAVRAGEIRHEMRRSKKELSVPDALVAAVAVVQSATLITANVKDFQIPGLNVDHLPS